jgi:hypothetical protein
MPGEKMDGGNWPHPSRLPLGAGWCGHCTAPGHEGETPEQAVLETFCNLGYAAGCGWSPQIRNCDAIRFAVSAPQAETRNGEAKVQTAIISLHFVCERDHRPVDSGSLEYDLVHGEWLRRHGDVRIQKMAECYLASYMKRKA